MRRVGQARQGPMLLKLYGPKPGPARPDVLRPEARPGPRGLRARAGLATSTAHALEDNSAHTVHLYTGDAQFNFSTVEPPETGCNGRKVFSSLPVSDGLVDHWH